MKHNAIGVIGGMGPEASQHFYGLLISHAQKIHGVTLGDQFPEIFIASLPVPDIILSQQTQQEAVRLIQDRIKRMKNLPIGLFCMACNTGHLFLPDLQTVTDVPFVSLLEEVPKAILARSIRRVGILATPTTIRTKLYENVLSQHGIETILPSRQDTERLGSIIRQTVAGEHTIRNSIVLKAISKRLVKRGAEGILLGCTELPLIFRPLSNVVIFDTLDILAKAVLERHYLLYSRNSDL